MKRTQEGSRENTNLENKLERIIWVIEPAATVAAGRPVAEVNTLLPLIQSEGSESGLDIDHGQLEERKN